MSSLDCGLEKKTEHGMRSRRRTSALGSSSRCAQMVVFHLSCFAVLYEASAFTSSNFNPARAAATSLRRSAFLPSNPLSTGHISRRTLARGNGGSQSKALLAQTDATSKTTTGSDDKSASASTSETTTSTTTSTTTNGENDTSVVDISDPLNGSPPFSVTLEGDNYSYTDAIQRTLGWVGAAIVFGGGVWAFAGSATGEEFFAGYLVEQSLSVDNLFVFLMLFQYFKVPLQYQDRVLNWGIYGAVVMRGIMIGVGYEALKNFRVILLFFAGILVYSSANALLGGDDDEEDPSENSIVKFSRSLIKSTDDFDGDRFFTVVDGVRQATPLFICMVAVEISDVVFAVDSIPAVFGVTENPLVVFSSNIFAIMGLRSLYTILSKAATDLKYLEPAVAIVLGFIGGKMIAEYFGYNIPTDQALAVVATMLGSGVGLSVWDKQKDLDSPPEEE